MASTIYTPQNPSPRNEVRDMLLNQDFTSIIDGVKCTDFQIRIYRVSDNGLVHDSTKTTLGTPLADGETLTYTLTGGTIANTGSDSYKWTVQVWNGAETVTSREFQFFAKTTPVLTFTTDNPITTQEYEFTATLTQAEGDIVNNYKFDLYDNLGEFIETSGLITSFNIAYTFDGFTNGDSFQIQLTGTTTGQDTFNSGLVAFTVSYSEPVLELTPDVEVDNLTSLITVTRPEVVQIIGSATPSSPLNFDNLDFVITGGNYLMPCVIPTTGQIIDYVVNVPLDFGIKIYWETGNTPFLGEIISLDDGAYVIGVDTFGFYYTINGITKQLVVPNWNPITSLDNEIYLFILLPTEVQVKVYEANQPIIP